jgi:uncharacterized protein (TIGR03083 family)
VGWLEHDRYETEFAAETARLGEVASGLDPAAPVPTCPQWTVRDLVTHVGTGHRWATGTVAGRLTVPPPYVTVGAPEDPGEWADWLAAGARDLAGAVREAGPDLTVFGWRPGEETAGFWLRKMLHDELVHRFDAELTARPGCGGGPGTPGPT